MPSSMNENMICSLPTINVTLVCGYSFSLSVGRPGFDFLVESVQNAEKLTVKHLCLTFSINERL